jgi:hypothetical protein
MKTLYKTQMRKAFSRGLRGKTNNVPGTFGKIFHRIGKDLANGVELEYAKVVDVSTWSKMAIRLRLVWPYIGKLSVIDGSKIYTVDLRVFFYDFDSVKDHIK